MIEGCQHEGHVPKPDGKTSRLRMMPGAYLNAVTGKGGGTVSSWTVNASDNNRKRWRPRKDPNKNEKEEGKELLDSCC